MIANNALLLAIGLRQLEYDDPQDKGRYGASDAKTYGDKLLLYSCLSNENAAK